MQGENGQRRHAPLLDHCGALLGRLKSRTRDSEPADYAPRLDLKLISPINRHRKCDLRFDLCKATISGSSQPNTSTSIGYSSPLSGRSRLPSGQGSMRTSPMSGRSTKAEINSDLVMRKRLRLEICTDWSRKAVRGQYPYQAAYLPPRCSEFALTAALPRIWWKRASSREFSSTTPSEEPPLFLH